MSMERGVCLCMLGCGNLGTALLDGLVQLKSIENARNTEPPRFTACVRSKEAQKRLQERYREQSDRLDVRRADNVNSVREADIIILAVDPADVEGVLTEAGLQEALQKKLLVSVAAGWSRPKLESTLYGSPTTVESQRDRASVIRVLPNIAALARESLTAIEISEPSLSEEHMSLVENILRHIGQTVRVPARLMEATTAVSGSTPAFFAVICDALIDASVAVGMPRGLANTMIAQAMKGTASLIQAGLHPSLLRDQGTSPEGCTIGGLMVLEEAGVRGAVGKALREAVTISRWMETAEHLNDTRNKIA